MKDGASILNKLPSNITRDIAMLHPLSFARWYLPNIMKSKSPDFHFDMFNTVLGSERVLLMAPRDHAKSTCFSFIYPLYRICMDRNIRISLVCDTVDQAIKFVEAIRHELEFNEKLIADFGNFVGGNWQKSSFTVKRDMNYKDPTVSGFGLLSSKRGDRSDLILCDDIINEKTTNTPGQRKKVSNWFKNVLTNFLEEDGGQIILTGTMQNEYDLYMELLNNPLYQVKIYRAITDFNKMEVLWPDKWSFEKLLLRRREIGYLSFDREFQNTISSEESSLFPPKLTDKCLDGSLCFSNTNFPLNDSDLSNYKFYMGVDLATSAKVGADYFVALVLGVDEDKNRRLFHILRKKGLSYTKQSNVIIDLHNYFDFQHIIVEANQYQTVLPDTLAENTDLPISGHNTGTERNTRNRGLPSLRVLFENNKYVFPYSNESMEKTDELLKELHGIVYDDGELKSATKHNDIVMALWLCELAIRKVPPFSNRIRIIRNSNY